MKNIHILPTHKPSQLFHYIERPDKFFLDLKRERIPVSTVIHKNIYITSDEEIKKGEYRLHVPSETISKWDGEGSLRTKDYKKIILTTDPDLIKDGIQAIPDEFLNWFVKNPSCEFAHLGFTSIIGDSETKRTYKIIIPKEVDWSDLENSGLDKPIQLIEEPKQETLEEVAERFLSKELLDLSDWDKRHILKAMVNMSKWQQEQNKNLYSEEETIEIAKNAYNEGLSSVGFSKVQFGNWFTKWFEQFKKK